MCHQMSVSANLLYLIFASGSAAKTNTNPRNHNSCDDATARSLLFKPCRSKDGSTASDCSKTSAFTSSPHFQLGDRKLKVDACAAGAPLFFCSLIENTAHAVKWGNLSDPGRITLVIALPSYSAHL